MARVLFYLPLPPPDKKHYVPFHRGVGQLASVLGAAGHSVTLRMPWRVTAEEVRAHIAATHAEFVFVSLTTPQCALLRPIAAAAAAASVPLLTGGPHPTFASEETLAVPGVTAIVRGEGERAALAFLRGDTACAGLVTAGGDVGAMGELADLAALPPPDREIFYACPEFVFERKVIGHEFAASRGCPYRCRYCSNFGFLGAYGKEFLRRIPVDHVIDEATATLARDPKVAIVGFHDDIFAQDIEWLREFAEKWRTTIKKPFWVNGHPTLLTKERVTLLKKAGCARVHVGVETGSEALRRAILGRTMGNDAIVDACERLRYAGIRIVTFIMLGAPGESEETYRATVDLLRRIRPSWVIQSFFSPLPGTPLGEECRAQVPEKSWEALADASFYLSPERSWTPSLALVRLREMGTSLLASTYER
jgi:radical SAM superfamily enzyme YgiQ (UPF0313 family)